MSFYAPDKLLIAENSKNCASESENQLFFDK